MSEFAEKMVQAMLPELNALRALELFTTVEVGKILKKRRAHEYKIRRKTKELKDFLEYIEYEQLVLELLKKRRKKIKCFANKKEIEVCVIKRIHRLFQSAVIKFPSCVEVCLKHIEFCIKMKEKMTVSVLFTHALKIHPHNENLWVMAAKYEMDDNASMTGARNLLHRSLRMNPNSRRLYLEYFRMELLNAEKIRKRQELVTDDKLPTEEDKRITDGSVAMVVFEEAVREIPGDVDFCMEFVRICRLFDFTQWIDDAIYSHLSSDIELVTSDRAKVTVACRKLLDVVDRLDGEDVSRRPSAVFVESILNQTWTSFNKTIEEFGSAAKWEMYYDNVLLAMNLPSLSENILKHLTNHAQMVCLECADRNAMSESMAIKWIKLLDKLNENEFACQVIPMLASKYPCNVTIWTSLFNAMTSSQNRDAQVVLDLLEDCSKYISKGSEIVQIWKIVISWLLVKSPENMEEIFEISVGTSNRDLTRAMKEMYLDWTIQSKSVKIFRKLFKKLSSNRPTSIELFKIYIQAELSQADIKPLKIRNAYEVAVIEFGQDNVDLWLDYIKFEIVHGSPENTGQIYYRAIKNLKPGLESEFIENHSLFKCQDVN